MDSRNPLFMSAVNRERNRFIELMGQAKLLHTITLGPVSQRRQITLKTMYDRDPHDMDFDVTATI